MNGDALHQVGSGSWAWLQRDGSWGWSNAGLVTDGEASLLVDTLYDLHCTERMLTALRDATPAAHQIDTLVNTHANGDHTYGNQLAPGATIVASAATAAEFALVPPAEMARTMRWLRRAQDLPWPLSSIPMGSGVRLSELADFFVSCFGHFDYTGITLTPPDTTFEGERTWMVGDTAVELLQVGPAHTAGDTLVYVPRDRVVYTGDILFASGHPIVWEGPVSGWVAAFDRILELDVDTIVPGHGPIANKATVRRQRDYLRMLQREATARYHAGMGVLDAARDITLDAFDDWGEAERVVVNVDTIYRELSGGPRMSAMKLFVLMTAMSKLR